MISDRLETLLRHSLLSGWQEHSEGFEVMHQHRSQYPWMNMHVAGLLVLQDHWKVAEGEGNVVGPC